MRSDKVIRFARFAKELEQRVNIEVRRSRHELIGYVVEVTSDTVTIEATNLNEPTYSGGGPPLRSIRAEDVRWIGVEL